MSNTESRFQAGLSEESLRSVELVVFDFDGVFTDNSVYVGEDGTRPVRRFGHLFGQDIGLTASWSRTGAGTRMHAGCD